MFLTRCDALASSGGFRSTLALRHLQESVHAAKKFFRPPRQRLSVPSRTSSLRASSTPPARAARGSTRCLPTISPTPTIGCRAPRRRVADSQFILASHSLSAAHAIAGAPAMGYARRLRSPLAAAQWRRSSRRAGRDCAAHASTPARAVASLTTLISMPTSGPNQRGEAPVDLVIDLRSELHLDDSKIRDRSVICACCWRRSGRGFCRPRRGLRWTSGRFGKSRRRAGGGKQHAEAMRRPLRRPRLVL